MHQLLEQALRFGVGEVVVLELLDPAGRIGRELIEGLELLGALARVGHLPLDAGALGADDLVELLLDVLERRAQIVTVELLLPPLPQPVHQIL